MTLSLSLGAIAGWLAIAFALAIALLLTGLILAGLRYQRAGIARDAKRLPPPGQLIDVGGRRLHLHTLGDGAAGNGAPADHVRADGALANDAHAEQAPASDLPARVRPTVIFESGLAASSLNWRPVQEAVARMTRACAYDRAGYGWSDPVRGPRTAQASATELRQLLRAASIPPPYILVAHSFGTYIAPLFAAEHRDEVAAVVLVDPITAEEWTQPDAERRRRVAGGTLFSRAGSLLARVGLVRYLLDRRERKPALSGAVLGAFGREADRVVRRIVGEVTKMPSELWPAVQAHWSRAEGFDAMAQHFRALNPSAHEVAARLAPHTDGTPALGDIPLVIISAANCPDARVAEQRALTTCSRRGRHVQAASGGHWVHLDEPALVIDIIRGLLDETRDARLRAR